MKMRKTDRFAFENPGVNKDLMFAFDPQRAMNLYFARKLAEAKAAKAAKAAAAK